MNSSELNQTIYNWKRAKVIFKGKTIFKGNPHEALQKFKELKGSTLQKTMEPKDIFENAIIWIKRIKYIPMFYRSYKNKK